MLRFFSRSSLVISSGSGCRSIRVQGSRCEGAVFCLNVFGVSLRRSRHEFRGYRGWEAGFFPKLYRGKTN